MIPIELNFIEYLRKNLKLTIQIFNDIKFICA